MALRRDYKYMKKIVIWGTGKIANEILGECKTLLEYIILGVVDNNKNVQGEYFFDMEIHSPERIMLWKDDVDSIVVLTDKYDDIREQVSKMDETLGDKLEDKYYFYKQSIIKRYKDSKDEEIKEVVNYLKMHSLSIFNYEFPEKYKDYCIMVNKDKESGLFYINHNGLNMYFSRELKNKEEVLDYYRWILVEQDEKSPHKYTDERIKVNEGDVVIDVGAAEGFFSVEVVEKAKQIYIIEADPLWVEALNYTFEKYRDKVKIINKYIVDYDEGAMASIDSIVQAQVDFVKMDIEGCEHEALIGASKTIMNSPNIKMAVCCYHSDFDQQLIEDELHKQELNYYTSNGYMWFPYKTRQVSVSTKLRKGIIRAHK